MKCSCGHIFDFNLYQRLYLFFHKNYVFRCPKCGKLTYYRLIHHIIADNTVSFEENKLLKDNRKELFKNG